MLASLAEKKLVVLSLDLQKNRRENVRKMKIRGFEVLLNNNFLVDI